MDPAQLAQGYERRAKFTYCILRKTASDDCYTNDPAPLHPCHCGRILRRLASYLGARRRPSLPCDDARTKDLKSTTSPTPPREEQGGSSVVHFPARL